MTVTEKEVIQSVTEAGDEWQYHDDDDKQFLIRFAAIICAKQREKDARICEETWKNASNERPAYRQNEISHGCIACANAIRGQE